MSPESTYVQKSYQYPYSGSTTTVWDGATTTDNTTGGWWQYGSEGSVTYKLSMYEGVVPPVVEKVVEDEPRSNFDWLVAETDRMRVPLLEA